MFEQGISVTSHILVAYGTPWLLVHFCWPNQPIFEIFLV